ncbi:hypothetical protein K1T71_014371 [Dendrolimus kikuchii]|uniref:Uncharacterized protein n=1 Tax=Dendrolimus kikuchii TaxID=765133 RepID=A0ACC1CE46_9NEOP|nr:hypothetical protein K1T71_014371 [Dendrolimus kikuchii]
MDLLISPPSFNPDEIITTSPHTLDQNDDLMSLSDIIENYRGEPGNEVVDLPEQVLEPLLLPNDQLDANRIDLPEHTSELPISPNTASNVDRPNLPECVPSSQSIPDVHTDIDPIPSTSSCPDLPVDDYPTFLKAMADKNNSFNTNIEEHNESLMKSSTKITLVPTSMDLDESNPYIQEILSDPETLSNIIGRHLQPLDINMAASGEVSLADSQGQAKLHPYLATLVRWCVSCLWSTATVLLHRLMTASHPAITAPRPQQKPLPKPRAPSTDHLDPEPKVECVVLHEPPSHTLDVIFVHGLYGSLGNTWRQGDWKAKYKIDPNMIPLRNHDNTNPCKCNINKETSLINVNECKINDEYTFENLNENITINNLNELKKILPNDNSLITEQFYNNTLLEHNVENYETQAKFVQDMFRNENGCDIKESKLNNRNGCNCNNVIEINECKCKSKDNKFKIDNNECNVNDDKCNINEVKCKVNEVKCKIDEQKTCEMGCGCICDDCYSLCWPRDWIKMDYPGARVISINYTSDPYLWRPLWIKGNKRLRLHERAEQMMRQLLDMGVGEKPIIWVGHSKGGLFIKQMYCEAYEAYLNLNQAKYKKYTNNNENKSDNTDDKNKVNIIDITKSSFTKCDNNINENISNKDMNATDICGENKIFKDDSNDTCNEAVCDNERNVKTENNNLSTLTLNGEINTKEDVNENCLNDNELNINKAELKFDIFTNFNKIDIQTNTESKTIAKTTINDITETNSTDNHSKTNGFGQIVGSNTIIYPTYSKNGNKISKNNYLNQINDINTKVNDAVIQINDAVIKLNDDVTKVNDDAINVKDVSNFTENESVVHRIELDGNSFECDHFEVRNDEKHLREDEDMCDGDDASSSNTEDQTDLCVKAGIWRNSVGFMFYSVPHRGSPLADIKTPITSRSIELLEISKDCALVLSLQERWLVATEMSQPVVRSLVETCRTLMSVLWLRIVSVDSADAGIGTLSGVSVDHREICKPSSRNCLLYKELTDLIHAAMNKCDCQ